MYCYDGLFYQLFSPGIIFLIACIWLFLVTRKGHSHRTEEKRRVLHFISILGVFFSLFIILKVGVSIINPTVVSYSGQFDDYYRDSRSAPPLPFTYRYRFSDGETTKSFCIDQFSMKKIYSEELEYGEWYTIYSARGFTSDVIVYIENYEANN